MGIVAVAFIPLMGLIPIGLNTSRQAIDTTIEAQILQQMTSQAQETAWSALLQLNNNGTTYYDAYGNVVSSKSSAIYQAGFSVATNTATSQPLGTTLPGVTSPANSLTTVTISISSLRTSGNTASKKYTVFVPNNGQ